MPSEVVPRIPPGRLERLVSYLDEARKWRSLVDAAPEGAMSAAWAERARKADARLRMGLRVAVEVSGWGPDLAARWEDLVRSDLVALHEARRQAEALREDGLERGAVRAFHEADACMTRVRLAVAALAHAERLAPPERGQAIRGWLRLRAEGAVPSVDGRTPPVDPSGGPSEAPPVALSPAWQAAAARAAASKTVAA